MTSHVTSHCEIGYDRSLGVENCPVCCVKGGAVLIMNIKTLHKDEFLSDFVHCIVTNCQPKHVLGYLDICSLSLFSTLRSSDACILGPEKIRVAQNLSNLSCLNRARANHQKNVKLLRFTIHRFVYLKCIWTQLGASARPM